MPEETCTHDWVYAPFVTASIPPISYKICRNCGEKTLERYETSYFPNEYDYLLEKFSGSADNDATIDRPESV